MEWLAWIAAATVAVRLAVAFVNAVSHPYPGRMRRRNVVAPRTYSISVLIPARDEAENIGALLTDLAASDDGICEIIVYDDQSSDGTADVVRRFAMKDSRIRTIAGGDIPAGWLGKNNACHRLARAARGDVLLFLDADVRVAPGAAAETAAYLRDNGLSLLSLFPQQLMPTVGTRLAVPLMNWILLGLLPLPAVRLSRHPSLSAANGQFMMFDAGAYRAMLPHAVHRMAAAEDIAIARDFKRAGLPTAVLLGDRSVQCTMYRTLREAVNGFSKNIFQFFGGSGTVCLLFVAITTAAPFLALAGGPAPGIAWAACAVLLRVFVSAASRQSVAWNILLMIPQQFILWKITITAFVRRHRRDLRWKGRNVCC
ncbi:MAG TPA: glycosyltransferase [Candidatus Tidjanibacter gallistercoris]|nr:glycosyltransferase [Candidatus Tidjanibacter gallistercoris]